MKSKSKVSGILLVILKLTLDILELLITSKKKGLRKKISLLEGAIAFFNSLKGQFDKKGLGNPALK